MLDRVRASGAKVRGDVRFTLERGVFRKFEFVYRHKGLEGLVRGSIRPSEHGAGWDLECLVAHDVHSRR